MWRILKFLVTGSWHEHRWVTIREVGLNHDSVLVGRVYYQQCVDCGVVKRRELG